MRGFIRRGGLGLSLVARMHEDSVHGQHAFGMLTFIKKGQNFAESDRS